MAELVQVCNTLTVTEGKEKVSLYQMLKRNAKKQLTSVQIYPEDIYDGYIFWPEAIKYLLRTYATSGAIREAIIDFRDTNQLDDEEERKFLVRLSTASEICRKVNSSDEKTTMYVE